MAPILSAKREEGQGCGPFNLQATRAMVMSTRPAACLPQASKRRHKHGKPSPGAAIAAARPGPEGGVVMVRRHDTLDKDAGTQAQQGENDCRHFLIQWLVASG